MAIQVDSTAVRKASNVRIVDDAEQFEHPVKKLGSAVTTRQVNAIANVITPSQREQLLEEREALTEFAETGEMGSVNAETVELLQAIRKAAQESVMQQDGVTNGASQARRIWPRKVAAIVLHLDATTPKQDEKQDDADDESANGDDAKAELSVVGESDEQGDESDEDNAPESDETSKSE